jgi:hypothetical protein
LSAAVDGLLQKHNMSISRLPASEITTRAPSNREGGDDFNFAEAPLRIGTHELKSRLIVGTGKYKSYALMAEALDLSGADCITVAVRRERLIDAEGKNLLDFIDTGRYTLLPNTAGCFSADDAIDSPWAGKSRRRLGQARSACRQKNAPPRSCCHARSDGPAGKGGFSGSLLYER